MKIINEKILLNISADDDDDGLPIPGSTLKIHKTLLKFNRHHTVNIKKNKKNDVIFFYSKITKYKVTDFFKKELKALLKKSLEDMSKRKEWKKWLGTPEGYGGFMTIDTLKRLI